jgi:uncharacterized protein Veg
MRMEILQMEILQMVREGHEIMARESERIELEAEPGRRRQVLFRWI